MVYTCKNKSSTSSGLNKASRRVRRVAPAPTDGGIVGGAAVRLNRQRSHGQRPITHNPSPKQLHDRPPFAVSGYVKGALLHFMGVIGCNAHGVVERRVQVFN